jgi:ComF family protein
VSLFKSIFRLSVDRLPAFALGNAVCVLCKDLAGKQSESTTNGFCLGCWGDLPKPMSECCQRCAVRLPVSASDGDSPTQCGACLRDPPAFDRTIAAFDYEFPIDQLIHKLKYGHDLSLVNSLALTLAARLQSAAVSVDCIATTPVTRTRLIDRGFNQATQLAKPIARALQLPLHATAVARVKDTLPQAQLPWKERHKNIRGAFQVQEPAKVAGQRVAVIDDVLTTGATLNEVARAIKAAGAVEVQAWVIARAQPRSL